MRKITVCLYTFIIILFVVKITTSIFNNVYTHNILDAKPQSTQSMEVKTYDIYIDLVDNTLSLFENGVLFREYGIASGKFETPSPAGIWKIINKSTWGEGFGGNWMGLNVPWGTYGIHGTKSPWSIGSDASHGCIRMYSQSAEELYSFVPIGTTVIISKGPFSPMGQNPRVMIPGDRGSDIYHVQMNLKKLKFYKGNLDGIYGEGLKKALFKFQESLGCSPHNEITTWDLKMMGIFPFE